LFDLGAFDLWVRWRRDLGALGLLLLDVRHGRSMRVVGTGRKFSMRVADPARVPMRAADADGPLTLLRRAVVDRDDEQLS
jgi:hypothetical protein